MSAQLADRPVDAAGDDAYVRLAVAAIEEFSVHGFHGTTVRDISRAVAPGVMAGPATDGSAR